MKPYQKPEANIYKDTNAFLFDIFISFVLQLSINTQNVSKIDSFTVAEYEAEVYLFEKFTHDEKCS